MSLNLPTGFLELDEQTTPSTNPPAGRRLIYPKSTGWYELDSGGTESLLGILDHGGLSGLTDDDHTIYPLLLGRSGGQTLYGGTGSGDVLELSGSSHATSGPIRIRAGDLGLDDAVGAADRRIRNVSGIFTATDTSQVEGRYISKDSLEQLGTADLSDGSTLTTYVANALDAAELQQLQAIGATTISAAQWGYLGALDQALATTDSPTFAALNLTAALGIADGGTGQATAGAAFDALSPFTTLGDTLYGGASGTGTRLAGNITATKQFLNQTGTGAVSAAPVWSALVSGDIPDLSATYQPLDTQLTDISGLSDADGVFVVGSAAGFVAESGATARTSIGLGTGDSPTFAALTLTAALTEVNGGTGQAAYASGDILYSDATNSLARLAKGTNGHVLTLAAGLPSWAAGGGGGGGGAGTSELLHKNFSASQTTASSGDQDLATYTMPADTLSTGDVLEWTAFGRVNDGTGSEGLRLKFGATTLHTEAPGADRSFYARVMIHQDGASDQRVLYTAGSSGNWAAAADTTEDETGTIAIKFVGFQDAGASAGRATFYAHTITIHRAP